MGEWGFGVIVFGCGEVVGTSTRNEAEERTGCADYAREKKMAKEIRKMSGAW